MKKGFTLVELIAIITLLGLIIVIVVPVTNYIIDKREKDAFKVSVYGLLTAIDEEYASNGKTFPSGGLNTKNIDIDINNKEQFTKGKIIYKDNTYYADRISNGKYCISGTRNDLAIVKCSIHLVDEDLYLDYSFACPSDEKECGHGDYIDPHQLISVTFGYNDDTPSEYYYSYDVGSKPGMITAYLVKNGTISEKRPVLCPIDSPCPTLPGSEEETPAFDLYITSDYKIYAPEDCEEFFEGFMNVKEYNFNNFDTSKVYNMSYMFCDNENLKTLDLSGFDTSTVENMDYMFMRCLNLSTLDISSFDTSNVIQMRAMFAGTESLKELDLSNFDTSEVEDMNAMFADMPSLRTLNVSSFDTSNVHDMSQMFDMTFIFNVSLPLTSSTTIDLDLSNFNTKNVVNMLDMFNGRNIKNLNISNFDFSKVHNIISMFKNNPYLNTSFTMNFSVTGKVSYNNFLKNAAQYGQVSITLDCTNYNPANIENVLATATYPNKIRVTEVSCPAKHTITVSDSTVSPSLSSAYPGTNIRLKTTSGAIKNYKLNGTLMDSDVFTMPAQNVNLTDFEFNPTIFVESEHNPYANDIDNVVYYENTFPGATSIKVTLNYGTESTNWDWIYVYGSSSTFGKYGGTGSNGENLTANITVPGNYVKIVFRTDGSVNGFYGFDATIEPVY